ncbi:MAG: hypothetical protein E6J43_00400 [Chloroflexi bacterium]|nr:MAG: hypothetical protein E6J43_00400 [Chloroflexota bacterium]
MAESRIAIVGGTGPEGLGLAMRFAKAGNMVFIGSRSEERAAEAVAKVKEKLPEADVFGGLNTEGAEREDRRRCRCSDALRQRRTQGGGFRRRLGRVAGAFPASQGEGHQRVPPPGRQ